MTVRFRWSCRDVAIGCYIVAVRFWVLGPVRVEAGAPIPVPGRRERCLLGVLLLQPGRVVPAGRLAELLWDGEPPERARRAIHSHVSRLRAVLTGAAAGGAGPQLLTLGDGYRLDTGPATVDAVEFRQLLDQATSDPDPASRVRVLRDALGLWRGPALADAASDWLRARLCADLEERRLIAIEDLMEASLLLRREREVLPELAQVASQHPDRERLARIHMRALYQDGRTADALNVYADTHRYFTDQLGLEPGSPLRDLHRAILRGQLAVPDAPPVSARPARTGSPAPGPAPAEPSPGGRRPPAQLPADVAAFTGREEQLARLDELLAGAGDQPTAVVISAIAGTAGVGKTTLATTWAHRIAGRFPDGQLYVNLRGYHPEQPMTPDDALAGFLRALGVPGQEIPVERSDRAAAYRSLVSGARVLIVLDNASSVEQVRPLLPGSGSCAVVVTSRDSLAGLVAIDGAHRIDLDLLLPTDAIRLLRRLIGDRVDAEPRTAATLAEQCARLPLALRVAAELAVSRPTTPLAGLVAELADQQRRLELLDSGSDPHAAVRAVFSWSIRHLLPDATTMFRLLGLHPGPDLDAYAAAALCGARPEPARRTLDLLARAHLVHPTGNDRYGMHDLLRAYAAHLAGVQLRDRERHAALGRLFDYYLATAAAAADSWQPAEANRRPRIPPPDAAVPDLTRPDQAREWLDTERQCLVAIAAHAATGGWPTHTVRLSHTLARYFDGGHYPDALAVHGHAVRAAEQTGDLAGQARALSDLSSTYRVLGRFDVAVSYGERARLMARRAGDLPGEASACNGLGIINKLLGNHRAAIEYHRQALTLHQRAGDLSGEARSVGNLGCVEERIGLYQQAITHHRRALALAQQADDPTVLAMALNNLGCVEVRTGDYESAARHYQRALTIARQLHHRQGEAIVLDSLGRLHLRLDQPARATDLFGQAVALSREVGDQTAEAEALNGLGEAAQAAHRASDAIAYHTDALAPATSMGARSELARAHAGLGEAHRALGDLVAARKHYEQALASYYELDAAEAEQVRARLATLPAT